MKQNTKDWIQYLSAVLLILSAITLAFTSFFMINEVAAGVNTYVGITVSGGLAIFGITTYFVNQLSQFKAEVRSELKAIREEETRNNEGKEAGDGTAD